MGSADGRTHILKVLLVIVVPIDLLLPRPLDVTRLLPGIRELIFLEEALHPLLEVQAASAPLHPGGRGAIVLLLHQHPIPLRARLHTMP